MGNNVDRYLAELKELRGVKVPEFAESCGLSASTVYNIRRKSTLDNVSIDAFLKIAHGLGMTAEDLYRGTPIVMSDVGTDDKGEPYALTDDEERLLDAYRSVDDSAKRRIMRTALGELDDMEEASLKNAAGA